MEFMPIILQDPYNNGPVAGSSQLNEFYSKMSGLVTKFGDYMY